MVVMGEYDGREVLVIVIVIRLLYNRTIRVRFGVQLSICILIRNVIFSVGFYLQISNKMYYLFFLLFLFVLEYISVHHNLPVVHNVLSLKYLFLYQILKWERIIPPTATDSYKKNVRFSIQQITNFCYSGFPGQYQSVVTTYCSAEDGPIVTL